MTIPACPRLTRRGLLVATALAAALPAAHAQNTPIKFQLDWRFEGPSALFLLVLMLTAARSPRSSRAADARARSDR